VVVFGGGKHVADDVAEVVFVITE